jgi:signal transduction histidine kinase
MRCPRCHAEVGPSAEVARQAAEIARLTRELDEAHRREAASADVLKIISRSAFDLQTVLNTLTAAAARVCEADIATIWRPVGAEFRIAATYRSSPEHQEAMQALSMRPDRGSCVGRTLLEGKVVHIHDILDDHEYSLTDIARLGQNRTILGAPLLHEGVPIGVIALTRSKVCPFNQKQIALVESFADQAVIAIENARLLEQLQTRSGQLQEALNYQTATAEVLSVISRSPSQTQPVFDAIVATAARLCRAEYAIIFMLGSDERYHVAATSNAEADWLRFAKDNPIAPGRGSLVGRVALEGKVVHMPDCLADPEFTYRTPQRVGKFRTMLGVPLLQQGWPVGVIGLLRNAVEPFSDTEIDLVTTFADQAVVAIENVRLFEQVQARTTELTRSLEYQTATTNVLSLITRSPSQVQPVFDAIVANAVRLCGARTGSVYRFEDGLLHFAAHRNFSPAAVEMLVRIHPRPPQYDQASGRAVLARKVVQVEDTFADPHYHHEVARAHGFRSVVAVPMLREGSPSGAIVVTREEAGAFEPSQIELLKTFGDQAVIAIESARLFEEVQARTRELAKTVEDLEIASQHKNQFVANMSHELRTPLAAILGYAELIQEGFYGGLPEKSLDALTRIRSNGKHLLGLINTVLDIAKIESGQFTLNMTEYAIESVVETVRAATESLAQNKKLTLTTNVAKSLPVGLGDEQRLTQVLLNLVGNAIKFTDAGEVSVSATTVNSHFVVTVADTGPGIPEEHQARIFEQFHQVDSSNTKAKGGTGLGLAIAKEIVEMHGGRIWVESTLDKGSTFQLELPIRAEYRKSLT